MVRRPAGVGEVRVKGIELKTAAQIAKLREANLIVSDVLDTLSAVAAIGLSTWDLELVARKRLKELSADSAFLGYRGYPAVLCASVNNVIVHGIPRKDVVLKDGDILSIDFGAFKDGWCGDSAGPSSLEMFPRRRVPWSRRRGFPWKRPSSNAFPET